MFPTEIPLAWPGAACLTLEVFWDMNVMVLLIGALCYHKDKGRKAECVASPGRGKGCRQCCVEQRGSSVAEQGCCLKAESLHLSCCWFCSRAFNS